MNSRTKNTWIAIAAVLITALVHAVGAPDSFHEVPYKGWLFVANALGSVVAAIAIFRSLRWGWWLGLLVTAGALLAYIASRTVGLPGLPAEPDAWFEPAGVVAMVAEIAFIASFAAAQRRTSN